MVFRQAGSYDVTLEVRNPYGSSWVTKHLNVTASRGRARSTAGAPVTVVG